MDLGELTVTPILDGKISGAPATAFPDKSPADWRPFAHYLEDGKVISQIGGFLVRSGERLVLIDAGGGPPGASAVTTDSARSHLEAMFIGKGLVGPALNDAVALALTTKMQSGALPDALQSAGLSPADITDVIFTHLHSDHIGWASVDGQPFFPSATYHCARADFDYFHGPDVDEAFSQLVWGTPSARDRLAPIGQQLELFDGDATIAPGVDVRLAPGHTPGSCVVVLSSARERALVLGDMVHCPVELQNEEWQAIGDVDPALAKRTRAAFIEEVESGDVLVAGSHFPGLRFGRLLAGQSSRSWFLV